MCSECGSTMSDSLQGCRIMMLDIPYDVDDLCAITLDLLQRCGYKEDLYIRPLAYKSEERVANLKLQDLGQRLHADRGAFRRVHRCGGGDTLLHIFLASRG